MNSDAVPAVSTNNDLYVVPIGGGTAQKITSEPGRRSIAAVFAGWQVSGLPFAGARRAMRAINGG